MFFIFNDQYAEYENQFARCSLKRSQVSIVRLYSNKLTPIEGLPELLFHYTDGKAALSIIKEKQLWLTDFRFLNDPTEILFALNAAASYLSNSFERIAKEIRFTGSPETLDDLLRDCEAFEGGYTIGDSNYEQLRRLCVAWCFRGKTLDDLNWLTSSRHFICSFSEDGDSLLQWRSYCADGGYALGFYKSVFGSKSFQPRPCKYKTNDQIKELMAAEMEKLLDSFVLHSQGHPNPLHPGEALNFANYSGGGYFAPITNHIIRVASLVKHDSFADEKEWRIVVSVPSDAATLREPHKYGHRVSNNYLIPYIKSNFENASTSPGITKINVGPFANKELAIQGLEDALHPNKHIEITETQTPYRVIK